MNKLLCAICFFLGALNLWAWYTHQPSQLHFNLYVGCFCFVVGLAVVIIEHLHNRSVERQFKHRWTKPGDEDGRDK
jgi:hypothetical protein